MQGVFYAKLTPALDPLFIAYNTGTGGRILHTICIVRKYFTQQTASNPVFGSFPVKNYSKERFKEWLRVNFCRRAAAPLSGSSGRSPSPVVEASLKRPHRFPSRR
jgi:hypothetical protein